MKFIDECSVINNKCWLRTTRKLHKFPRRVAWEMQTWCVLECSMFHQWNVAHSGISQKQNFTLCHIGRNDPTFNTAGENSAEPSPRRREILHGTDSFITWVFPQLSSKIEILQNFGTFHLHRTRRTWRAGEFQLSTLQLDHKTSKVYSKIESFLKPWRKLRFRQMWRGL